jgi:hypothetical protein
MITVGKLLCSKRTDKNISLEQVEKDTKIRKKYLKAIEEDDWSIFSSSVYISGVIKTYSKYLNIDQEKSLAYFRRDFEKSEKHTFNKKISRLELLPETKKIVIFMLSFIFIVFLSYFSYQFYRYLRPPEILIIHPENRIFRNTSKITITGKTEKQSVVTIYNEIIFPDKNGFFKYDFPLKKGDNLLKIDVVGPNGKQSQKIIKLFLE